MYTETMTPYAHDSTLPDEINAVIAHHLLAYVPQSFVFTSEREAVV